MYDEISEIRYKPKMNALDRELRAIKEEEMLTKSNNEERVNANFDNKVFKSLKKILIKITKAS
jgi:hypothetical protein